MLTYNPCCNHYAGDSKFCQYTQQHKLQRNISGQVSDNLADDELMSNDGLMLQVFMGTRALPQFCNTLDQMQNHFFKNVKINNAATCEVCGEKTIQRCMVCNNNLCMVNGAKCVLMFHNEDFFGLARSDMKTVHGKNVETWIPPGYCS